jgi:protein SCO1/2
MQRAFGVLSRDKMNHPVATFYRSAADRPWLRLDGFASPEQLEAEYRSSGSQ